MSFLEVSFLEVRQASFSYRGERRSGGRHRGGKHSGGRQILDSINFNIERGEHIALVGPNGAGKSTLLYILGGLYAPQEGGVFLDGENLSVFSAARRARRITLLLQGTRPHFPYNCFEIILMGLHPFMSRFAEPEPAELSFIEELMRETGVWGFAERKITELSGGEAQRVLFTRALAQALGGEDVGTRLLLLDEPFSELDISALIAMMKLFNRKAASCNIAIAGIHHDLHTAGRFAGRIIALKNARIEADGAADYVFSAPFFAEVFKVKAEIESGRGFCFIDSIED